MDHNRVRCGLFALTGATATDAVSLTVTRDGFVDARPTATGTGVDHLPALQPSWEFPHDAGDAVVQWPPTADAQAFYVLVAWYDADNDGALAVGSGEEPGEYARTPSRIFEDYDLGHDVRLYLSRVRPVFADAPEKAAGWLLYFNGKYSEVLVGQDELDGWSVHIETRG